MKILEEKKLSSRWAILYIFNPCVISALMISSPWIFAGILFFACTVSLFLSGSHIKMFAITGFEAVFFPFSIPALFLFLNKRNIKKAWVILPFMAASFLAFFLISGTPDSEAIVKTGAFDHILRFIFQVRSTNLLSHFLIFILCAIGLLIFHPALNKRYYNAPFQGIVFVFLTMIILQPLSPFSIFMWLAPFIVFRPSIMSLLLGFTIFPYAAVSGLISSMPEFSQVHQVNTSLAYLRHLVFFPIYISLAFAFYRTVQHQRNQGMRIYTEDLKTLSVIIPVLNEEVGLGRCIRSIRLDDAVTEIIVIDGGSTDNSVEVALKEGAEVIIHKKPFTEGGGRGGQIKAGIDRASGDVVAIVHADSIVNTPFFKKIMDVLNHNPDVIGGAVGCRFDSGEAGFRLLEFANNARMAYLGIAFGDQLQFFRRKPVIENHVFPNIPLMEDVELSMRLKNLGHQVFLFGTVQASTRRWQKKGFRNAIWVIRQVAGYIWERIWKDPDSVSLYREYYQIKGDRK